MNQYLHYQLKADVICDTFESMVGPVMDGHLDTSQLKVILVDEMDYILLSKVITSSVAHSESQNHRIWFSFLTLFFICHL